MSSSRQLVAYSPNKTAIPPHASEGVAFSWTQQDYREKMIEKYKEVFGRVPIRSPAQVGRQVPRVEAQRKLVLRASAELESSKVGEIQQGRHLIVLEEADVGGGSIRVRVGADSSPRGVVVHSLGWVTAVKEGEWKVTPSRSADGQLPSWSICGVAASTYDGSEEGSSPHNPAARRLKGKGKKRAKSAAKSGRRSPADKTFMALGTPQDDAMGSVSVKHAVKLDAQTSSSPMSPEADADPDEMAV